MRWELGDNGYDCGCGNDKSAVGLGDMRYDTVALDNLGVIEQIHGLEERLARL